MGRPLKYTDFDKVVLFMPGGANPPLTDVLRVTLWSESLFDRLRRSQ
jgi:hypothetical protein